MVRSALRQAEITLTCRRPAGIVVAHVVYGLVVGLAYAFLVAWIT
jgi:hypothetical protein